MSSLLEMVLDNPIIRREAIPRILKDQGRRGWLLAGGAVALLSLAIPLLAKRVVQPVELPGIAFGLCGGWAGFSMIAAAARGAGAIIAEEQRQTWDALIITPLRPWEVYLGKLVAIVVPFLLGGAILLPLVVAAAWWGMPGLEYGNMVAVAYLLAIAGSAATALIGLFCSAHSSSLWSAYTCTFLICWFIGMLIGVAGA